MPSGRRAIRVFLLALLAWCAVGVVYGHLLFMAMAGEGIHRSWIGVIRWQVAIWGFWALLTPLVWIAVERRPIAPPHRPANLARHLGLAVAVVLAHVLATSLASRYLAPKTPRPVESFAAAFGANFRSRGVLDLIVVAGIVGAAHWSLEARKARERERSALRLESELSRARLQALQLQIQPHFLFNTLHAVAGLVRDRRDADAVEMIAALSDLLRYILENGERQEVSLEEEIDCTRRYLHIQQIRFGDRLCVAVEVAPDTRSAAVPSLILQPLVENAVTHGIAPRPDGGHILLTTRLSAGTLAIRVFDDGPSLPENLGENDRIGLGNTISRLELIHGKAARVALRNVSGGVEASIHLPFRPLEGRP